MTRIQRLPAFALLSITAASLLLPGNAFPAALPASTPVTTNAKVSATSDNKPVTLTRPAQIALMFVAAISGIQDTCIRENKRPCTMNEMLSGGKAASGWPLGKLKYDPRTSNPDYVYVFTAGPVAWDLRVIPRNNANGGFYAVRLQGPTTAIFFNPAGPATVAGALLDGYGIDGDSFMS
jgi:hypothetical protein